MPRITDYAFLFQNNSSTTSVNNIKLSSLSSPGGLKQLKNAGINVNSKQFKAALAHMQKASAQSGANYTNLQAIKNMMSNFDSDGDMIDATTGLAGTIVTNETAEKSRKIVSISEDTRKYVFEELKKEFINEKGINNGDTTNRNEWYTRVQRETAKSDRLAASHTLSQYEKQYRKAMQDAIRKSDSSWTSGKSFDASIIENLSFENVEKRIKQSGNKLHYQSIDISL